MKNILCSKFKNIPTAKLEDAISQAVGDILGIKVQVDINELQFDADSDSILAGSSLVGSISGAIQITPNQLNDKFLTE